MHLIYHNSNNNKPSSSTFNLKHNICPHNNNNIINNKIYLYNKHGCLHLLILTHINHGRLRILINKYKINLHIINLLFNNNLCFSNTDLFHNQCHNNHMCNHHCLKFQILINKQQTKRHRRNNRVIYNKQQQIQINKLKKSERRELKI